MRTLVAGAGALGGVIAARLGACGRDVAIATRNAATADRIRTHGLEVSGVGGFVHVDAPRCAPLDAYRSDEPFDLIVLATKAPEALALARSLEPLLGANGSLLPIQNGGVAELIASTMRPGAVLGGLSNLGATMSAPGVYEQRNAGHLLIGELDGGNSQRTIRIAEWMRAGVDVRVTTNFAGAVWSKLLLNCSVTSIGAIAGCCMREYIRHPNGRALFDAAYDETLEVALASGARPERMLVDPYPPPHTPQAHTDAARDAWIETVLAHYGDLKPSMLQDFERGRATEIDFINGYVVDVGRRCGIATPANAAITATVRSIVVGEMRPSMPVLMHALMRALMHAGAEIPPASTAV